MGAEPVDLTLVVRECDAMLAAASRLVACESSSPSCRSRRGNAVLLAAVFRNLLANAIEHGSGRRREIRVFAEPDERPLETRRRQSRAADLRR